MKKVTDFAKLGFVLILNCFAKCWLRESDKKVVIQTSDSVAALIYDKINGVLYLARQERPAMITEDNPTGTIVEAMAGRFDVDLGVRALAIKEAREELGVTLTEDDVQVLNEFKPLALSPGILTERMYLTYAEVSADKIEAGEHQRGEDPDESITRVRLLAHEIREFVCEDIKTFALLQWFIANQL